MPLLRLFRFRDAPFTRKLTFLSIVSSIGALLLAGGALMSLDLYNQKATIQRNLTVLSTVVAGNTAAPLLFDDAKAAQETLDVLAAIQAIDSTAVYDKEGVRFASHVRSPGIAPPPERAPPEGQEFLEGKLRLSAPIVFKGDRVGSIYMLYDLRELSSRIWTDLTVILCVLVMAFLISLLLSRNLKAMTSGPILHLAETARQVTDRNDYSLRAVRTTGDELGILTDDFNRMLGEVQKRDEHMAKLFRDAEDAVRLRDEFISIASHELNTPLTTLRLQTQTLMRLALSGKLAEINRPKLLEMQESANRQVERFSKLIGDLLDVSRLSTGKIRLDLQEADLSEMVREVANQVSEEITRAGCALHFQLAERVIGQWDRFRIEQVISNLLTNAAKYGAGKPIHVTLEVEGESAKFSVRDAGIGIAEADQGRIFERFERAVSVSHFGGFGLGLFIVRQNLAAHGGEIWVESRPGEGSTFSFKLPLRPDTSRPPRA